MHSAHPSNTCRGIVFSVLKMHHFHSSSKINYSTQENKLLNDLLTRGNNQEKVFDMFKEAKMKLMEIYKERKNNKNVANKASLEETLELIKPIKKEK